MQTTKPTTDLEPLNPTFKPSFDSLIHNSAQPFDLGLYLLRKIRI